jgi:iron(III) transport system permease protein
MFAMVTISLNQRLTGTRRSYETIGGRGFVANQSKLRSLKKVFFTGAIIFQLLVLVVPLGLLTYDTFLLRTGDYSFSNLTLQNWIGQPNPLYNDGEPGVLLNPRVYKTAWN